MAYDFAAIVDIDWYPAIICTKAFPPATWCADDSHGLCMSILGLAEDNAIVVQRDGEHTRCLVTYVAPTAVCWIPKYAPPLEEGWHGDYEDVTLFIDIYCLAIILIWQYLERYRRLSIMEDRCTDGRATPFLGYALDMTGNRTRVVDRCCNTARIGGHSRFVIMRS